MAFLGLPKPWQLNALTPNNVLEIALLKDQPSLPDPPTTPTNATIPADSVTKQPKTNPIPSASTKTKKPIKATKQPAPTATEPSSNPTTQILTAPQLNAGDVLQMLQHRSSVDITPEFQARTQPLTDFHIPAPEIHDWLANIPYLDESKDKPKLQMQFYAEGIEGSIEKFFDKITISKTFTTQYGTKIHCALIGVVAMCGWQ